MRILIDFQARRFAVWLALVGAGCASSNTGCPTTEDGGARADAAVSTADAGYDGGLLFEAGSDAPSPLDSGQDAGVAKDVAAITAACVHYAEAFCARRAECPGAAPDPAGNCVDVATHECVVRATMPAS
jgi:hypothetical protein